MRHNGQPHLVASEMPVWKLDFTPNETPRAVCPACGGMLPLTRSMIAPHGTCPGSGQRIWRDLTPAEWARRYQEAEADADRLPAGERRMKPWPMRLAADD